MTPSNFSLNPAAIRHIEAQAQARLNELTRETIWKVRERRVGQPVDVVYDDLIASLVAEVPGIRPNEAAMREVAQAITDDELTWDDR